jgi:5'-nucleotidase
MLLAIGHLMRHHKPDLVLSGVNQGLNIAEDVTYSGTVAAAMEATLLGVRAIALSQDMGEDTNWCWQTSERWAPEVIRRVLSVNWPRNVLLNVNFPPGPQDAVKGIAVVGHGNARVGGELTEGRDPRGRTYFWIGGAYSTRDITPDTDREALREGKIAITPLYMDMTHYPMIETLQRTFR